MFTKVRKDSEWHETKLRITDTNNPDIKHLEYVWHGMLEITWYVQAHVALQLQESQEIMQPDWLTNIDDFVVGLHARDEVKRCIEDILDCNE